MLSVREVIGDHHSVPWDGNVQVMMASSGSETMLQ